MHTGREDRARVEEPRGTTTQEEATTTSAAADAALRRGIEGEAWGILGREKIMRVRGCQSGSTLTEGSFFVGD